MNQSPSNDLIYNHFLSRIGHWITKWKIDKYIGLDLRLVRKQNEKKSTVEEEEKEQEAENLGKCTIYLITFLT